MLKVEITLTEAELNKILKFSAYPSNLDLSEKIKNLALSHIYLKAEYCLIETKYNRIKKDQEKYDFFISTFLAAVKDFKSN